jgi:oxygen-independent coproporphyrinogen-3 oxidase
MIEEQHPGLYIHVPFCRSKCLYCDFYSVASPAAIPAWLDAVRREGRLYKDRFHAFDSLYIGGGTPTVLDERQLAALIEWVLKHFAFRPESEMTMEANPDGLSRQKLKAIRDLGINRISLGVQSLVDRELKYLGRRHSSKQALKAFEMLRSIGFADVGVDLMYGFEAQSFRGWKSTIDQVLELRPEHISCYQLTFEPGAPFRKMKAAGRVHPIGEKLETAFFIWTSRCLEKHGYLHYEISNFALSPEFMCRHNRKYWGHVPYLGLGPSAHSFLAGSRWWNAKPIERYCRLLADGKTPVEGFEVLSEEQLDLESLDLGFRTSDGISLHAFGGGLRSGNALEEARKSGLVRVSNGRIQPTRKGFLVADSLPLMFSEQ